MRSETCLPLVPNFNNLLRASERHAIPFQQAAKRIFEVQAILSEIDGTKQQINKTENEIGFIFHDNDKLRARDALKTRLEALLKKLDAMCTTRS